jgi:capsular exopolysaccharide synthesis family protein
MSQIFDALQRSEAERLGVSFPVLAGATELLHAAEQATEAVDTRSRKNAETASKLNDPSLTHEFPEFKSLPVSIPPESRLVCLTGKESLAAEKFRFLGVRLRQLQQSKPLKKVLVTSSSPSEGKSMIAANLACTLARKQQHKVLLLDGDLRRPVLAQRFGLGRVRGLSEWLQEGGAQLSNIYRLESAGLWIFPAGNSPQNPLELMQTAALSALMEQLVAQFDWIIIDSPPVLPLADTSVWVKLVDGVLLVARQGTSARKQIQRGLETLDQSKLLGALINGSTDVTHSDYYHYRYSPQDSSSPKDSRETLS